MSLCCFRWSIRFFLNRFFDDHRACGFTDDFAAGGAFAQANDTIAKVKASGSVTMGVRESSGALSYTLGDGKFAGFHVEMPRLPGRSSATTS